MSHTHDSENVNRLWSDRQPRGYANIIRCLWCYTLLVNLHDFVTESFNPEHIFRDAHTVPFCLTADHIATCHMSLSARIKPAQFWSAFGHLLYGKCSVPVTTGSGRTRGVPRDVWKRGSFHGVPWTAQFWMRGWWSDTTAGNGCSGMHRLTVSRQLVLERPGLSIE